jgi:Na+/H+ antiporter NhaD/arsenite permease-like protein
VLNYLVIALLHRGRLTILPRDGAASSPAPPHAGRQGVRQHHARKERAAPSRAHTWLRWNSIFVTVAAVILFFTGLPLELVALAAAAVLLLGRVKPAKVYAQVDWGLLVMFSGLFIVVHAFQRHVIHLWGIEHWHWLLNHPVDLLSVVSATLSNIVSNVPAVLLLEPVVQAIPAGHSREEGWLALATSSTFAGNLTVLGSVANLIVVEKGAREGVRISFWDYCKVGLPLTLLTLIIGIAWLMFVPY